MIAEHEEARARDSGRFESDCRLQRGFLSSILESEREREKTSCFVHGSGMTEPNTYRKPIEGRLFVKVLVAVASRP